MQQPVQRFRNILIYFREEIFSYTTQGRYFFRRCSSIQKNAFVCQLLFGTLEEQPLFSKFATSQTKSAKAQLG